MAASCGIHVEDPRSFPENDFEVQKHPKTLDNSIRSLEPSVESRTTENPFGDGLSNLDSDLQSMKLEYTTVEVSSKNSLNLSTAWNPNWINASFYSDKAESCSRNYNSKNVSENGTNQNESSVGFEANTEENPTKPVISDANESANASTQNLCFTPVKKDWPNNFLLDSSPSNCEGLPVKMSTPLKLPGIEVRDKATDIMNVSTQTDFIFSPSLDASKKETFSQGNQASVMLKDASVNTWQVCTCSDADPAPCIGSPLPSTETTKITDNAWVSFQKGSINFCSSFYVSIEFKMTF